MAEYRYRVRDWDTHFENHRTRDLDFVRWLMVPNKQHGMGFTRIMAQEDGASIFGIWYLVIEACSQQRSPRLGWLTDDGRADGTPWTVDDMAVKWRRRPAEIARAMDVLCSPKVGWIETVENDENSTDGKDAPESDTVSPKGGTGLQQNAGEARAERGESAGEAPRRGEERRGEEQEQEQEGARLDGAAAAAAAAARSKNRETVRTTIARLRWQVSDSALADWLQFLEDAGCQSIEECVDCLHWVKRQARKDGVTIKWARHADGYEIKWRNRPRIVEQSA